MKFNSRHLIAAVILLLGSILYNVWIFWGSSSAKKRTQAAAPTAVAGASATAGTSGGFGLAGPVTMPPPPPVDLSVAPAWNRDPFRRAGVEAPRPEDVTPAAAAPMAAPDPVVGAIMFSPERRLAIVNGRITGVGDRLDGGIVADITRDAILVRDLEGDERRYALHGTNKRAVPK